MEWNGLVLFLTRILAMTKSIRNLSKTALPMPLDRSKERGPCEVPITTSDAGMDEVQEVIFRLASEPCDKLLNINIGIR